MAVIKFSKSLFMRIVAGVGTAFLVVAGFLAMIVGTSQKIPHLDKATLAGDVGLPKTAFADAPQASCGTSCVTISCGSDGCATDGGSSCACGADGSCGSAGCGASCDGNETGSVGCDGDGGGKVICTELFTQGLLDPQLYQADEKFALIVPSHIRTGYLLWARPVVRLMRKSPAVTHVVSILAIPWAKQMAFEMGTTDSGSKLGKVLMSIGMPVCATLGTLIALLPNDQKSLLT